MNSVGLFFLLVVACAELDTQCAHGETYWCSSLYAAKSCGAINHCKTTVWKNQQLKQDTAEVCQFCESVLDDIRKYIAEKKSKDDIAKFMNIACGIIPERNLARECTTAVEKMVPDIIELINDEIDSQLICSLMGVCAGTKNGIVIPQVPRGDVESSVTTRSVVTKMSAAVEATPAPICTDCKKFFGDLQKWIVDKGNEKIIEDLVDRSICSVLATFEQVCKDYVHEFLPEVLALLADYYDANAICESFHFCNSSVLPLRFERIISGHVSQISSPATCLICESILAELQALGNDKTIQDKLSNLIKSELCARMKSFKSECEIFVDLYAPKLFQFLATELDPTTKCRSIGVCASDAKKSGEHVNMIPASTHSDAMQLSHAAGPQCVICEWVMKELAVFLENNATEQEIIAGLDIVCARLPKVVSSDCKYFVDKYGPEVIEMLINDVNAEKVCTALHLCSSLSSLVDSSVAPPPAPPTPVTGAETCFMCETVVRYARAILAKNATIIEVKATLDKVCNFLPERMYQECRSIVDTYSDMLVQALLVLVTPQEVCQSVHACPQTTQSRSLLIALLQPVKQVKEVRMKRDQPGSHKCSWGPSYWCDSRANADHCDTLQYCKEHGFNV